MRDRQTDREGEAYKERQTETERLKDRDIDRGKDRDKEYNEYCLIQSKHPFQQINYGNSKTKNPNRILITK